MENKDIEKKYIYIYILQEKSLDVILEWINVTDYIVKL